MFQKIITTIGNILIILIIGILLGQNERFVNKLSNITKSTLNALSGGRKPNIYDSIEVEYDKNNPKIVDGYFLLTSHYAGDTAVILLDSSGAIKHSWDIERGIYNKKSLELHGIDKSEVKNMIFGISDAELLSDGDLVFTQDIRELSNYRSQRIARINKSSELIWQLNGAFHHEMYQAEDGNFYSVGSYLSSVDSVFNNGDTNNHIILGAAKVVSPSGELISVHKIDEGFVGSDYEEYIYNFDLDISPQYTLLKDGKSLLDPFHLNSAQYLTEEHAKNISFANKGDILFSIRGNSTIGVYRPSSKKVVWAKRGPWRHQHFVRADNEGKIFIYDNEGKKSFTFDGEKPPRLKKISRILSYDVKTDKIKEIIPTDEELHSYWRGYYKFLDNGTYIMSSSKQGKIIQVDEKGEVIWRLYTAKGKPQPSYNQKVVGVKYYEKDKVNFELCGGICSRSNNVSN